MTDRTRVLDIALHGEDVTVRVAASVDLDAPFTGECVETGETLRFGNPWALDIREETEGTA